MHLGKNEAKQAKVKLITHWWGVTLRNKLETVTQQNVPLNRTTTDEEQLLVLLFKIGGNLVTCLFFKAVA